MYLAVVFDYDMYPGVAEGELGHIWKENNIFDFWKCRGLLSNQTIRYNPTHRKYSGDTIMRPDTQHNQSSVNKSKYDARGKNREAVIRGGLTFQLFKKT